MSDKKPKGILNAFNNRGSSARLSTKGSFHRKDKPDGFNKTYDTASIRSSRSSSDNHKKYYIQQPNHNNEQQEQLRKENSDLHKINLKLKTDVESLKEENESFRKLLIDKDNKIQEMTRQLDELQNNKLSKHLKFASLRQNFHSIFKSRKTKDEIMKKNYLQSIPENDEAIQVGGLSNSTCALSPTDERYFRTTLDKMEKDPIHTNVPRVLVEAVKVIEAKFMHVVGLYRVSGNYAVVQDMRFQVNENKFEALHVQKDPHTITGIIKLLLRELEEPVISLKHLDSHIDDKTFLALDREEQVTKVQNLVETLPRVAMETLIYLMKHLRNVIRYPGNQNSAHSLSVVVGACIFYELLSDVDFQLNLAKCTVSNKCIEIMIEDYSAVFEQV